MAQSKRLAVVGLDCGTPELMFDRFAADMPTLTSLRKRGLWGPLRSVVPPITVPAWACMMSGRTPGELGIYGFRNRKDSSYEPMACATSDEVRAPRLWDLVDEAGGESVVLGVPGTYPPSAINGCMVSCFLTPSADAPLTHPAELRDEVQRLTGGYVLDVPEFATSDRARVAQRIFDMSEQRFRLARHLADTRKWDLFAMVDMGPDRLHHGFWRHCDPTHPGHEPGNPFANLFRDYYRALDRWLGELIEVLPDDTALLVVSDHGGQRMVGGFCLNQWLVDQGLLVLNEQPHRPTPIRAASIDWARTTAWGDGGYYGRLFLNVKGREPNGTVPRDKVETVRQQLVDAIEALAGPDGAPMGNRAFRPEELYPEVRGIPPDLIVYVGNLRWRAIGSLGLRTGHYTTENDTGPDEANHAEMGVFCLVGDGLPVGRRDDLSLYDVAPTAQRLLDLSAPDRQIGTVLL